MASEHVVLHQVFRPTSQESPFSADSPGFTKQWWKIPAGAYRDTAHEWFIVASGDMEAGRIEVNTSRFIARGDYRGWAEDRQVAEITFVEVRNDLQSHGIGTSAVDILGHHYRGRSLVTHPKNSDGFWESLGWERRDNLQDPLRYPVLYSCPRAPLGPTQLL